MNNISKYMENSSNNEEYKLEDANIYKGNYIFTILRIDGKYNNSLYVKLNDGREGYLFTADGYLAG